MLSRYRGKTLCPECEGTRLRKDANYVKIADRSISELLLMPIDVLRDHFSGLKLNEYESKVAKRLLIEITNRLNYLCDVGLSYLNLNRLSNTLSGGEVTAHSARDLIGQFASGVYVHFGRTEHWTAPT